MSDKLIRKYIHGREADLEAEVVTLRAQLAEAEAALQKYGCHQSGCVAYHYGGCDCGLAAAKEMKG
jgi:hypothetical protein